MWRKLQLHDSIVTELTLLNTVFSLLFARYLKLHSPSLPYTKPAKETWARLISSWLPNALRGLHVSDGTSMELTSALTRSMSSEVLGTHLELASVFRAFFSSRPFPHHPLPGILSHL